MLGMERMRRLHVGTYLGFGLEYIMVQQQSLTALDVPPACFRGPQRGEGDGDDCGTPLTAAEAYRALVGR